MNGMMGTLGSMGQSFVNSMMQDTPKHILKGICDMVEPHMIIAKAVKTATGQVFQSIEQAEKFAKLAETMGSVGAALQTATPPNDCGANPDGLTLDEISGDLDIPTLPDIPMSLEEVFALINGKIDEAYPEDFPPSMKPQLSTKGLDLTGTLPYTFVIPPLTPFGIIYLLLNLGEWPANLVDQVECTERSWPPEGD